MTHTLTSSEFVAIAKITVAIRKIWYLLLTKEKLFLLHHSYIFFQLYKGMKDCKIYFNSQYNASSLYMRMSSVPCHHEIIKWIICLMENSEMLLSHRRVMCSSLPTTQTCQQYFPGWHQLYMFKLQLQIICD